MTVRFHYTNRTNATTCNGNGGRGLYNRAALPSGQEAATTDDNSACIDPPPAPAPELVFNKDAGPVEDLDGNGTDAGDRIRYTFTVTNRGNVRVTGVAVADDLLPSVACSPTSLEPGASAGCTADYLLSQADIDTGSVNNIARATGNDPNGATVTSPTDSTSTSWTPLATLRLEKRANPPVDTNGNGVTDAGDRISYAFTVTNSGSATITNVAVTDPLLAPVSCAPTTLLPGQSAACTAAPYVIRTADVDAGSVANTAEASGRRPDGATVLSNQDSTSTSLVAAPSLSLTKRAGSPVDVNGSGLVDAGDRIPYTFTVTNTGNVTVSSVAVVDPLLTGLSCTAAVLAPGQATDCVAAAYEVTPADEATGAVVNHARATGTAPRVGVVTSPEATTTTPVSTPRPALTVDKRAAAPVDTNGSGITDAGDTISYSFTVANTGNVPLTSVTITDPTLSATPIPCTPDGLPVGGSASCGPLVYQVTEVDEARGSVANSATASGTDPDRDRVTSQPDTTSTAVTAPSPALTLVKTAGTPVDTNGSGITDAGDTIAFTFRVTNTGNVPITGIAVTDPLLAGAGIAVGCAETTLAPGRSTTCAAAAPYMVAAADVERGSVRNAATARGTDPDRGTVTSPEATTTTPTTAPAPGLALVKTAGSPVDTNGSGITDAGDTIAFTFRVTNTGNVPVSGVAVSDPLLAAAGISVTCAATSLLPAASTTCTANSPYVVTAADLARGAVVNTATAAGTDPDRQAVTSAPAETRTPTTTPAPALSLAKTAEDPVDVNGSGITDAGDTITYRFVARNTGNVPLAAIAVNDPLLAAAGITVTCDRTTLAPGQSASCTTARAYVITAADVARGTVVNIATVAGRNPDGGTVTSPAATTTTPTTAPDPRLVLDKNAGSPVDTNGSGITDAGDTISFSFTVTNSGNVPLTGLSINDPMLSAAPIPCAVGTLAAGRSTTCGPVTYTVTATDQLSGAVENTAVARATSPDGDGIESAPDRTSTPVITPRPALNLVKSAAAPVDVNGSGITDAGDTIAYSFTVGNAGNVPVSGIAVHDPMLSAAGIAVTCQATVLQPGGSTTCTAPAYTVTEADETRGAVHNVATATGTDPDRRPVTSPQATATTPVTPPAPKLSLAKSAAAPVDVNGSGITDAGDTIAYSFAVTNAGNVPVSGVHVTDDRLTAQGISVTCESTVLRPGESTTCTAAAYTVTAADEAAGTAVNLATAGGTDPDSGPVASAPDSTQTPVTRPRPLLELEKTAGTPSDTNGSGITDAGDRIVFTFAVTNNGNVPVHAIGVDDPLLAGQGLTITCAASVLAPRESTTCTAPAYTVTRDNVTAGTVTNSAAAVGLDPDRNPVRSAEDGTNTPTTRPAAQLELEKTAGTPVDANRSGITDAGDTVVFTFVVHNRGNVPVRSIEIVDERLAGLDIACAAATLAPDRSTTCTAEPYVVTEADEAAGAIVNSATAAGVDPDGGTVSSPPDTATVPVTTPAPGLTVEKTAGAPQDNNSSGLTDAGDTITYSFLVTNVGNVPLTAVSIADGKVGEVTCPAGVVLPTRSVTCTSTPYVVTAADVADGAVVNSATAAATDPDGGEVTSDPDTSTVPTTTPRPVLTLVKVADDPVDRNGSRLTDAGDTIRYHFQVTNAGNVPVSTVTVVDGMLAGQTAPAIAIQCPAGRLLPGDRVDCTTTNDYTVTAADVTAGAVVNTATATATDPDLGTVASGPASTVTNTTLPEPRLVIDKVIDGHRDVNGSGIVDAGDEITYSFTVTNRGNVPVAAVEVIDPIVRPTPISCTDAGLDPDESTTCGPVVYTVTAADVTAGAVANSARAAGIDPDDGVVTSPPDTTSVTTVRPEPNLVIEKTAGAPVDVNSSGITDAGDRITFSFTVTNQGNVPVSDVGVDDPMLTAAGITVTCAVTFLEPDQSTSCVTSRPYVVTAADVATGAVANWATATGVDPDDGPVTSARDTTSTPTTLPQPSLTVRKFASDVIDEDGNGLDVGDTVTFAFRVLNSGNVPLSIFQVHDAMLSPGPIPCSPPLVLGPGQEADCVSRDYVLTQADLNEGALNNTATASARNPDGGTVTSPPADTSTPLNQVSALHVVKSVDSVTDTNRSGLTDAGDTIGYSYLVSNPGNVTIFDLRIDDPMLAATAFECRDPEGTLWSTLAPHTSVRCVAPAPWVVTAAQVTGGHVVNVATAVGEELDGDVVRSAPSTTSTPTTIPQPQLDVVKVAGTPVDTNDSGITDAGDTIAFTFTVTNTGNVPLRGISIDDPMLAAAGITITCVDAVLDPRGSTQCAAVRPYVVTAADVAARSVANSAHAAGIDPDDHAVTSAPATTTTPTTTPQPALSLVKRVLTLTDANSSGLTDAGDRIRYEFTVTNTGNVPVTGVGIDDPMLAAAGIAITCADDRLAPGRPTTCTAVADYRVTAVDVTNGAVANSATATGSDPDRNAVTSPPATTATPTHTPRPGLELRKTVGAVNDVNDSGLTDAGDTIDYAFTVTNTGNVPVWDVTVSDPLLAAAGITVDCSVTPDAPLPPGGLRVCRTSAGYRVTAQDETEGLVTNTATAAATDPDAGRVVSPDASTTTPTTVPEPALVLAKSVAGIVDANGSGITDAGDAISYTFTVTNTGNVPVRDLEVVDPLLQRAGLTLTCPAAPVLPGDPPVACVASGPYLVTSADVAAGSVANVATARGVDPDGDRVTSPTADTSTPTTTPRPGLLLDKQVTGVEDVNDSGLTDAGDVITYSFTVTNTGNVPLTAPAITDPLLSADPIPCDATVLAVGGPASTCGPVTYTVTAADVAAGAVANVATATVADPDRGTVTSPEDRTTTSTTTPAPALQLVKAVAGVRDVNGSGVTDAPDEISYTFTVTNVGNVPVTAVAIDDPLLAAQGITITCDPSALLLPGQPATCLPSGPYVVTVADERAGTVRNRATATASDPDHRGVRSPADSTSTSTTEPFAGLTLAKSVAGVVDVNGSGITDAGDTIDYTFLVTNIGNVPVSAAAIDDLLLAAQGITITCDPTALAPGASATCTPSRPYVVTAADERAGIVVNVASAGALDPDGDPVTSPSDRTATVTTESRPALVLDKVGTVTDRNGSGLTDVGDTVAYTFTVTNTGNVPVSAVWIDDPGLAGLTVACPDGPLAPGRSTVCTAGPYSVTDADEVARGIANTATAHATDPDGDPVTSPPDSWSTAVAVPEPALSLDKVAGAPADANGNGILDAGDTITYTFIVTNTGNVPLSAVTVADPLLGTLDCAPTLPVGASTSCATATYVLTQDDLDAGAVLNTATAGGIDPDGRAVVSAPDSTATPLDRFAGLGLVKRAELDDRNGDGRANAGEVIRYQLVVTNVGNVRVSAITVSDPMLADLTCPADSLAPGAVMTCTADHVVTAAEAAQRRIVNVATVTGTSVLGAVSAVQATAVVPGSPGSGGLAYTGASPAFPLGVAGLALLAGMVLVGLARRRVAGEEDV